jgi:hypothetical protein
MPKKSVSKKVSAAGANLLTRRTGLSRRAILAITGLLGAVGIVAVAFSYASGEPVHCTDDQANPYFHCLFAQPAPVMVGNDKHINGYLSTSPNWILCQSQGADLPRTVNGVTYHNTWWAYTEADNRTYGWVNATYAHTGGNYGPYGVFTGTKFDYKVPACNPSVKYWGSTTAAGKPPQTEVAKVAAAKCSITNVPARVAAGEHLFQPNLTITNTGNTNLSPTITYTRSTPGSVSATYSFHFSVTAGQTYNFGTVLPVVETFYSSYDWVGWQVTGTNPSFSCSARSTGT